uniref:Uncharacterized protein n=1 Tax=Anguilla anguilla TaxID=7936 RepID=A0A0E9PUW6_ANGAN
MKRGCVKLQLRRERAQNNPVALGLLGLFFWGSAAHVYQH